MPESFKIVADETEQLSIRWQDMLTGIPEACGARGDLFRIIHTDICARTRYCQQRQLASELEPLERDARVNRGLRLSRRRPSPHFPKYIATKRPALADIPKATPGYKEIARPWLR